MELNINEMFEELKKDAMKSLECGIYRPNETLMNDKIKDIKLFQFVKHMPKGADLHVHGVTLLPINELIEFLEEEKDLVINVSKSDRIGIIKNKCELKDDEKDEYMEILEAEKGVMPREEIVRIETMLGLNPDKPWNQLSRVVDIQMGIETDLEVLERYYKKGFEYYAKNNVMHLEMKIVPLGSQKWALDKVRTILKAYHYVKDTYKDFTVKVIACGLKFHFLDMSLSEIVMDNAKAIYENIKDDYDKDNIQNFLVGIDFVNDEDASRKLSEYTDMIKKARVDMPEIELIPHAGESQIQDESNLKTAIDLGAKRIGHGFSLYKFEEVKKEVKEKGITLEVCPISNQILGYANDLRLHPGKDYIREGLSVVIASDDPGYFEADSLVDDYFAAILSWDLTLEEVKKIVFNSIDKATLDEKNKNRLRQKVKADWDRYVEDFKKNTTY